MSMNRKTFLQSLGIGVAAAGGSRLWAEQLALPEFDPTAPDAFWSAVRNGYDFAPGYRYFNSGGLGPSMRAVRAVEAESAAELEAWVETGHDLLTPLRDKVGAFLGAQPDEVAFVRNATEGNGIVAGGVPLEPGDEVIFESHAHPGGSFPWLLQAERRGVAVRLFEPDTRNPLGNLERIKDLVTPRTRAVQVSHITAPTGIKMPVADIARYCRGNDLWFHVDGAQSAGMIPIDFAAMGCDSYATSGHKWLGAPRETGVLLVQRERQDDLKSLMVGAYSGDLEDLPGPISYYPGAMRYEYGTRDNARAVGLGAAMDWQDRIGRDRIEAHGRALAARLHGGLAQMADVEVLSPRHAALRTAMVSFRSPKMEFGEIFSALRREYMCRCRPVSERDLNAVRVSCHVYTTAADIDYLLNAISEVLATA